MEPSRRQSDRSWRWLCCRGENGSFAPRTPLLGGRSACGSTRKEHHPGLSATSVWLRLKFCRRRSAAELERTASFDAVGACTPYDIPFTFIYCLGFARSQFTGETLAKFLKMAILI
eukprot:6200222-Pleurochrysis_carterae.AAC.2